MSSNKVKNGGRGGRGRGRSRGRGRGRGGRSQDRAAAAINGPPPQSRKKKVSSTTQNQPSTRTPPIPKQTALKQNGEKGAESFTVSEAERIKFTRILMDLREGNETSMDFPSTLTNTERKFLHELAGQLGLLSKSIGKGENRRITVKKRNESKKTTDLDDLPMLKVGRSGTETLKTHLQRFPPTHLEELESRETGAALVEALTSQVDDTDAVVSETLKRLGLGVAQKAPQAQGENTKVDLVRRRRQHEAAQRQKHSNKEKYQRMQRMRARLPAFSHQHEIVKTVAKNAVTIIEGETGSGKSTQVGQFILDANPVCNIVVTQPRRISAISIGERVAEEQCLPVGGIVGYQVRLESAQSRSTQLLFLTPGVLLRKLQSSPTLSEYSHIIIDEIHERDKYQEFLLIALRDLLRCGRNDLRVILMSATLQTNELTDYFTEFNPAQVKVEGRTFPVQEFFLEDVLTMTGYIDASTGYDASLVANKEIEHELAALKNQQESLLMKCSLCGQDFVDAIELGTHMAVCDVGDSTGFIINKETEKVLETFMTGAPTFSSQFASPEGYDDNSATVVGEFEDYDVEGTPEVVAYESFSVGAPKASVVQEEEIVEANEHEQPKWDGKSSFKITHPETNSPNQSHDALLDQYQAMHDDEQVDYFLLLEVIHYIVKSSYGDGAILVFFPGWQEISEFTLLLEGTAPFHNSSKYLILPLHSGIPSQDQRRVLQRPPEGTRKIVLATNIAETSLTIEDVAFVVDSGRAKLKDYDPHLKTSTLQPAWISKASSKQRKGRAGRTKAGVCFHLFSRRRYENMADFVESELLRTPLEEMCLMCKSLGLAPGGPDDDDGIPAFLAKALSVPHVKSVTNAIDLLVDLGAMLPETNELTTLGECLSTMSVEPRVGKMVVFSNLLGCARSICSMAVAMSYKSPFVLPPTSMRRAADDAKIRLSRGSESDQVTVLNALIERDRLTRRSGQGAFYNFCRTHFLGQSTMQMISDLRKNLTRELISLGFENPATPHQYHNRHDNDHALWQAAIAAGLYPNVASRRRDDVNFSTMTNRKAKIHVSSVNAIRGQPLNSKCEVPDDQVEFIVFGEMVRGKHFFTMNQTTHLTSPLPLLLLCGTSLSVQPEPGNDKYSILNVDDFVCFRCPRQTAAHIVILRKRLFSAFWTFVADPGAGLNSLSDMERDAVEIVGQVFKSAHSVATR